MNAMLYTKEQNSNAGRQCAAAMLRNAMKVLNHPIRLAPTPGTPKLLAAAPCHLASSCSASNPSLAAPNFSETTSHASTISCKPFLNASTAVVDVSSGCSISVSICSGWSPDTRHRSQDIACDWWCGDDGVV